MVLTDPYVPGHEWGWGFLGELDMDLAPLKDLYFIKILKLMYYKPCAVHYMLIKSIHDVLGEYSRETRLILPAGLVGGCEASEISV